MGVKIVNFMMFLTFMGLIFVLVAFFWSLFFPFTGQEAPAFNIELEEIDYGQPQRFKVLQGKG